MTSYLDLGYDDGATQPRPRRSLLAGFEARSEACMS
jgi:hypothetical protein